MGSVCVRKQKELETIQELETNQIWREARLEEVRSIVSDVFEDIIVANIICDYTALLGLFDSYFFAEIEDLEIKFRWNLWNSDVYVCIRGQGYRKRFTVTNEGLKDGSM